MKRIANWIIRGVIIPLLIIIGGLMTVWLTYPLYETIFNGGNILLFLIYANYAFGIGGTLFTTLILFIGAVLTGQTESFISELKDIIFH